MTKINKIQFPLRIPIQDSNGNISREWQLVFQKLQISLDQIITKLETL